MYHVCKYEGLQLSNIVHIPLYDIIEVYETVLRDLDMYKSTVSFAVTRANRDICIPIFTIFHFQKYIWFGFHGQSDFVSTVSVIVTSRTL